MKNFIILFILLSSCSGKIKEGLFCKSNSDCNKTDSVCKTSVCNNNVCIENHKEDLTSCGNDEVCYNGACVVMSGSCNSSEDCLSGNSCKLGVCSGIKTCIYTNKSEGTSCGEGSACYNGYCSGKCVKDENCSQANDCVTGSCLNSGDTYTFSQILSSLFWLNNNWYAQAGSKVYKYDDTFNLITTYDLSSVGSFINGNQIYSDGLKWYITSYSDSKLYSKSNKGRININM